MIYLDVEAEYDPEADAYYFDLDPACENRTTDMMAKRIAHFDYDAGGNLVGIEIL